MQRRLRYLLTLMLAVFGAWLIVIAVLFVAVKAVLAQGMGMGMGVDDLQRRAAAGAAGCSTNMQADLGNGCNLVIVAGAMR